MFLKLRTGIVILLGLPLFTRCYAQQEGMRLNQLEYLQYQGVNVMLAHDFYPEGHQGGVGIIQNGQRVATNGDIRLEPTPGQWSPIPAVGKRVVDKATQEISVRMEYPNEAINGKGFNPITYPDLKFAYHIRVLPAGKAFRIIVDLDHPLPEEWIGRVGFNIELYPGILFGKSYDMDRHFGVFPQQANGQVFKDQWGQQQVLPMAKGRKLTVAPESDQQRLQIENVNGDLQLLDGRANHNNGWFVVRSLIAKGATRNAVEWLVTPHAVEGWKSEPVIQVSQVGYHPKQQKIAVIELDANDQQRMPVKLLKIGADGVFRTALTVKPLDWGNFLRYHYIQMDFTRIEEPGMYLVEYGKYRSQPFQISTDVYKNDVWQPTLSYFLPAQMCHMRVNDKYRVWHGWCHLDDARMAPLNYNHFDGYIQGNSTLTKYRSGENVPGLNRGGWHDAGDFDMRIESQAETIYGLTLAYEEFGVDYDNTTVDQKNMITEMRQPDGKPDVLQQIEHGLLSVTGGYQSMGRFYRGIIEPTIRQYVMLGDPANLTDNAVKQGTSNTNDDRWVFTEDNPSRSLSTAAALAAASRVMKGYNDTLAAQSIEIAKQVWLSLKEKELAERIPLAVELLITTGDRSYADFLLKHQQEIAGHMESSGWIAGRSIKLVANEDYRKTLTAAVKVFAEKVKLQGTKTPYGVPYQPDIWGAGWGIQNFGYKQYFLYTYFPGIFPKDYLLHAVNFILGCHPGSNTASFVSGVGANSMTTAYGFNRADRSYIPGGVTSGTALIRPDFPELLNWPYLWQQGEYVLGGGTTDYLFLILAADHILNK